MKYCNADSATLALLDFSPASSTTNEDSFVAAISSELLPCIRCANCRRPVSDDGTDVVASEASPEERRDSSTTAGDGYTGGGALA